MHVAYLGRETVEEVDRRGEVDFERDSGLEENTEDFTIAST